MRSAKSCLTISFDECKQTFFGVRVQMLALWQIASSRASILPIKTTKLPSYDSFIAGITALIFNCSCSKLVFAELNTLKVRVKKKTENLCVFGLLQYMYFVFSTKIVFSLNRSDKNGPSYVRSRTLSTLLCSVPVRLRNLRRPTPKTGWSKILPQPMPQNPDW